MGRGWALQCCTGLFPQSPRLTSLISVSRSPSYFVYSLVILALLGPEPRTYSPYWPRSADYWATATLVNITIDDTSTLIAYSANNTWRPSTVNCSSCLDPDTRLAYAGTWHDGTHIIPTQDADDLDTEDADKGQGGDHSGGKSNGSGSEDDDDDDDGKASMHG